MQSENEKLQKELEVNDLRTQIEVLKAHAPQQKAVSLKSFYPVKTMVETNTNPFKDSSSIQFYSKLKIKQNKQRKF